MIVKITGSRQVTFPVHVLDTTGVGPDDRIEIVKSPEGYLLKPRRIDHSKLGILKDLIPPDAPPFDIRDFRDGTYDPALRD